MVFDTAGAGLAFLVGRVLFGAILAFTGLNQLLNLDGMVPYAEAKGVPAAGLLVPVTGLLLLAGGLAVALGIYPAVGAGAIALFLLVTTPVMHDFWAASDEEKQSEINSFLKNTAMLGAALVFVALGSADWPYAVGLGLF